jgi:wyosine [tRNA(Phe)-imidazoG37] synthetase (radical SAM superfamily)
MPVERENFYTAKDIVQAVKEKVKRAKAKGEPIDYLTFVPDGEPTLDANLGQEIDLLKPFGIKIAVISNASLIWREDVRQDLSQTDWVSLKVDAVINKTWHQINRPQKSLKLATILEGMLKFADTFKGELTTETMLIHGINDNSSELKEIADFLAQLKPNKAYLAIPTRPPAQKEVKAASEPAINTAYQIFTEKLSNVEYLIGYEGNAFAFTGEIEDDLLSITSVHPMRQEAVMEFLKKASTDWKVIEKLIKDGRLLELEYEGRKFYMRKLPQQVRAV